MRRLWAAPAATAVVLAVAGCSGAPADETAASPSTAGSRGASSPVASDGHDHSHEGVSLLVGDGTRSSEVGYTLRDARLPRTAGQPGTVSFQIRRYDGRPVTDYLPDHTKDLHLYVVRDDLAVFRHLHPAMTDEGVWSGTVNLPEPGDYRVVAEFVALDESGRGDHVMLGRSVSLPGDWAPSPPARSGLATESDDGVVAVRAEPGLRAGPDGRLDLVASAVGGGPVTLGTYLGAPAHVVGFAEDGGAAAHLHPEGAGTASEDGTHLTFVTDLARPGAYVFYVQVRVDDFLHTVPVRVEVLA